MKHTVVGLLVVCLLSSCDLFQSSSEDEMADPGAAWIELFDGESLTGWDASESPDSWSVEDGLLAAHGPRSHLYYVGEGAPFTDFELEAEVMTKPNSNSGIYFHTRTQTDGWPRYGFEVQVNNSYHDPQKTGSIYGVVPVNEAPASDDEWFTMNILVEGKHVVVRVDGDVVVDYTEPDDAVPGDDFTRVLDIGTFALQAHDPESRVFYRSLKVRKLP